MIDKLHNHYKKRLSLIDCEPKILEAMEYTLISNGKMFRPLVFLCLCESLKIKKEVLLDISLAIECIHVYSLIHDDLPALDNDELRRGKLTCHMKFGEDIAILTGDALLTYSFEILSNLELEEKKCLKLVHILASYSGISGGMINGQVLDMTNVNPNITQLKKTHLQKTAKLITVPFVFYSVISELDSSRYEILGKNIGLLYQMQDDFLDYYGNVKITGKKENSDLKNNKVTYATIYSKEKLSEIISDQKKEIFKMYDELSVSDSCINMLNKIVKRV